MEVTLSASRIQFTQNGESVAFVGMDLLRAKQHEIQSGNGPVVIKGYAIHITLTGDAEKTALEFFKDEFGNPVSYAVVDLRPNIITNQPTWTNDKGGVTAAMAAITPIIRAYPLAPGFPGVKNSLTYDGGEIQLVNDLFAPGIDMVYGTDGAGARLWKPDAGALAITGLTGDGTATGPGVVPFTLSATGVVAGSYTNADVTVDAKGRILSISNGTAVADPGYKDHFLLMGG